MESTVIKRSVAVARRKTSISLEQEFWTGLKDIAGTEQMSVSALLARIRIWHGGNLSSAVRVFVLDYYKVRAGASPPRSASFEITPAVAGHESRTL